MSIVFYLAGSLAVVTTAVALTRLQPVHALLYLVVSLLAVAVVFFTLGAPFVAALEIIVYAGAIMVFFVFVIMMLNLGESSTKAEKRLVPPRAWIGPSTVAAALLALLGAAILRGGAAQLQSGVGPKEVSRALFGSYALAVELASLLLTAALVGAYHLGVRQPDEERGADEAHSIESRADVGSDSLRAGPGGAAGAP